MPRLPFRATVGSTGRDERALMVNHQGPERLKADDPAEEVISPGQHAVRLVEGQ